MPAAGFPALPDGSLDLDNAGAITSTFSGLPLTAAGKVAVATEGVPVPAKAHNGFQFDAADRLCVTLVGPVVSVHNGFAFDVAGRLCVRATAGTYTHNGASFDVSRLVFATGA